MPVVVPSIASELLIGRDTQVAAGAHGEVADDGGFEIDGEFRWWQTGAAGTLMTATGKAAEYAVVINSVRKILEAHVAN